MFRHLILLFFFQPLFCSAQDSIKTELKVDLKKTILTDSFQTTPKKGNRFFQYSKKREQLVTYGQIAGYTANFAALYQFWYKDAGLNHFKFFNDNEEYLQVDKASHIFASYTGGRMSMQMWKWSGASKNKYVWLGGLTGLGYLSVIEIMDGFSPKWGFSWGDYTANVVGTSLLIGQELLWDEQRIQVKYSTHYQKYEPEDLERFAQTLYGKDKTNRLFKDYNPQTYWLSFNIKSFFKKSELPSWLNIAVGYGAENIIGARNNNYIDATGFWSSAENEFPRYRQWYLAPDIDLTKIKTKSKFLKTALFVLNSFKFPTPSLELSQGSLKWNWIHF
ncbi:MAG: DUF2279 domain-containing protein [Chitinophagaceae bacterium]|nr:DUF2279 domain-containing protein [Chitinophagaceae bacterium]